MNVKPGMTLQPTTDLLVFVSRVVVADQMQLFARRSRFINCLQKTQPFLMPVSRIEVRQHATFQNVERREECGCSVSFVVVGLRTESPRKHRQAFLSSTECLNLTFLINAQHNCVLRRTHIEPQDVTQLFLEVLVVRELECLRQVRLQVVLLPHPLYRRAPDADFRSHRSRRPVRPARRFLLSRLVQNQTGHFRGCRRFMTATRRVLPDAVESTFVKPQPPQPNRFSRRADLSGDVLVLQSSTRHEKHLCSQHQSRLRKMDRSKIAGAVQRGLHRDWSPEQIAGRLRDESPHERSRRVCSATIYLWIKQDEHRELWESHLRRRGKLSRKRNPNPKPESAHIRNRPEVFEARARMGDFEGDTILGRQGSGGIVTLVDRKSRLTLLAKIDSKQAEHVAHRSRLRLKRLADAPLCSVTLDNGTEFADFAQLETLFEIHLYFADPGCPHQRGTNENTNGLLRQYFPRGTDFRTISFAELRRVEDLLNNRPRDCLGYRTPNEIFFGPEPSQRRN